MTQNETFRVAVLSVVKHDYLPRGVASHPRFELVVVADDDAQPDWVHERNEKFAREFDIPYVRNVEEALEQFDVQVACVSSEAERHCDLSVRAANAGLHVVQDKPMSTKLSECDRVVDAVEKNRVKFLMWNRNGLPAVVHAHELVSAGRIGDPYAIHVDFYFSKDAGPPKGSSKPGNAPTDWRDAQKAAHVDGSDGGVGHEPMGELQIEGIYPLAYINLLTGGANVERVFARTTAHFHQLHADNNVDDLATVTLEMERGLVGSLCIGRIGAASHPDIGEIKIHVLGTDGALVLSEARPEVGIYYRDQPAKEHRHHRLAIDNDFLLMENFADAIDNDGDTMLNARIGRSIVATVDAAIESGRCGSPVNVAHRM
ncbi:MAG: Gfo/Idh/MocA family oxidoreductase [Planctomycetota bacterium]|jgi:predicted dehydrogenase|nr:Gfo/Idh/MocA family oxidoreductase [Planctomycetota bacterium]